MPDATPIRLPSAGRIADDAAADRLAGVELEQHRAALGVERAQVAGEIRGEHEAAGRRRDAGDHGRRRRELPAHGAGVRVEGRDPTLGLARRSLDLADGRAEPDRAGRRHGGLRRELHVRAPVDGARIQACSASDGTRRRSTRCRPECRGRSARAPCATAARRRSRASSWPIERSSAGAFRARAAGGGEPDASALRSSTDKSPSLFADATIGRPARVTPSAGGPFTSQSCSSRLTSWL